jgi:hypothetical protein
LTPTPGSLADHEILSGADSLTRPLPKATVGVATTGGVASAVTEIETTSGEESSDPSLTLNVNESGPS